MKEKRNMIVKPVWVENSVNSNLKTTITIADAYRDSRKQQVNIVLPDLSPYMVNHIAEQCVYALNKIKNKTIREINDIGAVISSGAEK